MIFCIEEELYGEWFYEMLSGKAFGMVSTLYMTQ